MPPELQCIRPRSSYPVKASLGVSVGLACGHIQCTSLMLTPSTGPCALEEAEPTHLSEKVKEPVSQLCLTLCNPGFSVHGILQARMLEWVPFTTGSSQTSD